MVKPIPWVPPPGQVRVPHPDGERNLVIEEVPLPFWLADSGGKGIQVVAVAHGEAQLVERWGEHGRQVILDTCSVKVYLTDTTTLKAASKLCGQASWRVHGQEHSTRHDIATPDMIRQLSARLITGRPIDGRNENYLLAEPRPPTPGRKRLSVPAEVGPGILARQ